MSDLSTRAQELGAQFEDDVQQMKRKLLHNLEVRIPDLGVRAEETFAVFMITANALAMDALKLIAPEEREAALADHYEQMRARFSEIDPEEAADE